MDNNELSQNYKLQLRESIFLEGGKRSINKKYNPKFSIITVVLNNEKFLEETINSVISQKFKDFEYIIIDGGSKDKTLQIINKYKNYIDYYVSQKDKGIYDAFNKGMSVTFGQYVVIINSDDVFTENALEIIDKYTQEFPNKDFIFGSVKKHWGVLHGYKPEKIKYSWGFYSSHSTGFFIKRNSAVLNGLYNLKYKYHADYDYFYRMIVKNKMKGIATKKDEIVGIFRRGGFSSTISFWKLFKEELLIRFDNGQNIFLILIIFIYKSIKNFKRFF